MHARLTSIALVSVLLLSTTPGATQVFEDVEDIDFDRPEAWAMKYFTSLSLFTGLGVPERMGRGTFDLGFEGGYVPRLDEEARRVGFEGTKVEDLNRTAFFGRIRARIGLSESTSLELGYLPPIDIDGTKANLFAVAVGRPIALSPSWDLGVRGYGQLGTIQGDVTCSAEEIEVGPNPFGCEAPSEDELTQRVLGAELAAAYVARDGWRPYFGLGLNYLDLDFRVDARYRGVVDRSLQRTSGSTIFVSGGIAYVAADRWRFTAELFYTWLSVLRPSSSSVENDGLMNGRFLVTYRIR